jgi:hypothetical protein
MNKRLWLVLIGIAICGIVFGVALVLQSSPVDFSKTIHIQLTGPGAIDISIDHGKPVFDTLMTINMWLYPDRTTYLEVGMDNNTYDALASTYKVKEMTADHAAIEMEDDEGYIHHFILYRDSPAKMCDNGICMTGSWRYMED